MKDYDILDIVRELQQGNQVILDSLSNKIAETISKANVQVENKNALTSKEVSALMSFLKSRDRQMGIGTKESRSHLDSIEKQIRESIEGGFDISFDAFRAKMDREYNKMIAESQKNSKNPVLNFDSKKAKGNDEAKELRKEYAKDLFKANATLFEKFKDFFDKKGASDDEKGKKVRKNFIADFIEELGKAPSFGAILTDIVRLITYLGATYLRKFGDLGKILGVALLYFGPTLLGIIGKAVWKSTTALIGSLGKLITSGLSALGKTLAAAFLRGALARGNAMGLTGRAAGVVGGATGLALGATGLGLGALFGTEAIDSAKDKKYATATALGASSIAAIVGGIAAAFGATFGAPLIAIAAAVGGITLLVKHFDKLLSFVADILKKLGIITDKGEDGLYHPAGSDSSNVPYSSDGKGMKQYGKLKVGKYGEVLNASSLSQAELKAGLDQYRQEDPTSFNRLYEVGGASIADLNSFINDAKVGGGALLHKGATKELLAVREELIKAGMSKEKASSLLYSSGLSSATSPHKHGALGHENVFALATDIIGKGWTREEYSKYMPIAKKALENMGYRVTDEKDHIDVKPKKNLVPSEALKARIVKEEQNLSSSGKSIKINGKDFQNIDEAIEHWVTEKEKVNPYFKSFASDKDKRKQAEKAIYDALDKAQSRQLEGAKTPLPNEDDNEDITFNKTSSNVLAWAQRGSGFSYDFAIS